MSRIIMNQSPFLLGILMALAISPARAQDVDEPNPGGGSFEVVAAEGLAAQFGAQYGTLANSGLENNFGGYYLSFENPTGPGGSNAGQTGDSIMGDNYGGEYFAEGSEVDNENTPAVYISGPDGNTYEVSSYLGPYFISPPGAHDTVLFTPQATPATSPPIPIGGRWPPVSWVDPTLKCVASSTALRPGCVRRSDDSAPCAQWRRDLRPEHHPPP